MRARVAQAVLRIVESPSERARLASAGRARMLSHLAWPQSMQRLDAIIDYACRAFVARRAHSLENAA